MGVLCDNMALNGNLEKAAKPFYYQWEKVLGVETHLLKIDAMRDVTESKPLPDSDSNRNPKKKRLIVIVPGNPGAIQYYEEFALAIWNHLGRKTPILGISHAGHVYHPNLSGEEFDGETYPSLQFQIDHKKAFLENHIPSDVEEIIVIAHSIGTYTSLHASLLMPEDTRIVRVIGLFPTMERMATAPLGRYWVPVIRYGRWLLFLIASLVSVLPDWGKKRFFRCFQSDLDGHLLDAVMNLARLPVARNCFLMCEDEMEQVTEFDGRLLKDSGRKVTLYYGRDDHWVPQEYYADMRRMFPDGDFHLSQEAYDHAFVVRDVVPMAQLVAGWLQ